MLQKYEIFLEDLLKDYRVNLQYVDSSKLRCNALIFKIKDSYTILCKKKLPDSIKFFSILHEVGHVALNYFSKDPFTDWSEEIETEINLWALSKLKNSLTESFYIKARSLFIKSEDEGFKNLELYLDENFK